MVRDEREARGAVKERERKRRRGETRERVEVEVVEREGEEEGELMMECVVFLSLLFALFRFHTG